MNTRRFFTLVVAVLAIAFATPALTQDQEERYSGLAQHLGTGPSGQTPIEIVITRWSSIEETQKLVDILVKDGHKEFADALGDTEETGFIRFPGGRTPFPSTRLHLARQFQDGDKRTIMLATPRPVGFLEAARGDRRTLDYDLTMLQLEFDGDADGSGTFIIGAEIAINPETHKLEIKIGSTAPAAISNLKKQN